MVVKISFFELRVWEIERNNSGKVCETPCRRLVECILTKKELGSIQMSSPHHVIKDGVAKCILSNSGGGHLAIHIIKP